MDVVWKGSDNVIDKAIRVNRGATYLDAPENLTGANKLQLKLVDRDGDATVFDSAAHDSYFSVDRSRAIDGQLVRLITLKLGGAALDVGEYDAILTVFTSTHTQGLVVGEFRLSVRDPG